jgi:hypothetical protein
MVIGRGRRREHPNQHFVLVLRKKDEKKIRENRTEKKYGKKYWKKEREKNSKKVRETVWEKKYGEKCT